MTVLLRYIFLLILVSVSLAEERILVLNALGWTNHTQ